MNPPLRRLSSFAEEPFRLFFPLGVIASVIGVLLWPAAFRSWIDSSPPEGTRP